MTKNLKNIDYFTSIYTKKSEKYLLSLASFFVSVFTFIQGFLLCIALSIALFKSKGKLLLPFLRAKMSESITIAITIEWEIKERSKEIIPKIKQRLFRAIMFSRSNRVFAPY